MNYVCGKHNISGDNETRLRVSDGGDVTPEKGWRSGFQLGHKHAYIRYGVAYMLVANAFANVRQRKLGISVLGHRMTRCLAAFMIKRLLNIICQELYISSIGDSACSILNTIKQYLSNVVGVFVYTSDASLLTIEPLYYILYYKMVFPI